MHFAQERRQPGDRTWSKQPNHPPRWTHIERLLGQAATHDKDRVGTPASHIEHLPHAQTLF
jgi:hypothetical protein